jgi:hypothetical protein
LPAQKIIYAADGTIARVLHADDRDPFGDFAIETFEDVEPLLDSVKHMREVQNPKAHMRHVAEVPVTIYEKAVREGWANDQAAWARFLNDPDNRAFRVWEGRL